MSIWNKVLLGLIAVASLAFLYFAMRTLKTHQHWRDSARRHEQAVDRLQQENLTLLEGEGEGDAAQPGIERLQVQLDKALIDRHRAWTGCAPQIGPQAAQTGQVSVTIDQPNPHGISDKSVVFVFEEDPKPQVAAPEDQAAPAEAQPAAPPKAASAAPSAAQAAPAEKRHYLGEFKVAGVAEKQVQLEPSPAMKANPEALARLAASQGPWTLYEMMPRDSHTAFAGLSEEDLKKVLPPQDVAEYAKDGQTATKEGLQKWGVRGAVVDEHGKAVEDGKQGIYQRALRDYQLLLRNFHADRMATADLIATATRDRDLMTAAVADADKQIQFRAAEQARLTAELTNKYSRERDAVLALRNKLDEKLKSMRASLAQILADNQAVAGQIAKIQMEATRQIDARTRGMAQTAPGAAN